MQVSYLLNIPLVFIIFSYSITIFIFFICQRWNQQQTQRLFPELTAACKHGYHGLVFPTLKGILYWWFTTNLIKYIHIGNNLYISQGWGSQIRSLPRLTILGSHSTNMNSQSALKVKQSIFFLSYLSK